MLVGEFRPIAKSIANFLSDLGEWSRQRRDHPGLDPIGANLKLCFDPARLPHPALSRGGERVFRIPSLDGRGKGGHG